MADSLFPTDLAAAVAMVRSNINEPTAAFWTDAEIQNWLSVAAIQLSAIGLGMENNANVTLASGTMEYDMPTNVKSVLAAIYNGGSGSFKALAKITPKMVRHVPVAALSAEPAYFYLFAGKIGFWPCPGASQAAKTVAVYGYKTTDDITDLSDECQAAAIDYATAMAFWKDAKNGQAAQAYARFIGFMDALKRGVSDAKADPDSQSDRAVPFTRGR